MKDLKVALVHDFLIYPGGAEKVLEVLSEMFPDAPIYTLHYDKERMKGKFQGKDIRASFLQKFPKFFRKHYQWLLPFYPVAPEIYDLRDFDLVISSSGAWSKGIITRLNTTHIAYIHSPMRFVWDYNERYLKEGRKEKLGFFIRPFLSYLRIWDKLASERPDYLIANSKYTADRINKYYRRESKVIYPPVSRGTWNMEHGTQDTKHETNENRASTSILQSMKVFAEKYDKSGKHPKETVNNFDKYFLIVSRLSPYKKIGKAIEAFNKLELPLVIIGEGKQEKYLKSIAKSNIKFLGWQSEEKLNELYKNARAFIFPGVDDFGLAPAESLAAGVPVIALKKGGAKEIVEEGKTGEFFESSTPEVIADGVRRFAEKEKSYDREYIISSANKFSKDRFKVEIADFIKKVLE